MALLNVLERPFEARDGKAVGLPVGVRRPQPAKEVWHRGHVVALHQESAWRHVDHHEEPFLHREPADPHGISAFVLGDRFVENGHEDGRSSDGSRAGGAAEATADAGVATLALDDAEAAARSGGGAADARAPSSSPSYSTGLRKWRRASGA